MELFREEKRFSRQDRYRYTGGARRLARGLRSGLRHGRQGDRYEGKPGI